MTDRFFDVIVIDSDYLMMNLPITHDLYLQASFFVLYSVNVLHQ